MMWPDKTEEEWLLFLADLTGSSHDFFLLVYDRQFTYGSLLRRLQNEFNDRGWKLIGATLSSQRGHLVEFLGETLHSKNIKGVFIHIFPQVQSTILNALNLIREELYDLPANIIFLAPESEHHRFLTAAQDLVTWVKLPYYFTLPRLEVPALPQPAPAAPTATQAQIRYFRQLILTLKEQQDETQIAQMLPMLAKLYTSAGMDGAALAIYRALKEHYRLGLLAQARIDHKEKLSAIEQSGKTAVAHPISSESEAAYTYSSSRYGIGLNRQEVQWRIDKWGAAILERIIEVEAYSLIESLDTYLLVPEKSPEGETRHVGFISIESLSADKDVTIQTVQQDRLRRHNALIAISPSLSKGEKITYKMLEQLPQGLYAINLTEEELTKREADYDYCGWNINRPTRKVALSVTFPAGHRPDAFGAEVRFASTGGLPANRLQYEETRRIKKLSLEEQDGRATLKLEVDYPMVGLIYVLCWKPVTRDAEKPQWKH